MPKLPVPLLPRLARWSGVLVVAVVVFYFSVLDAVAAPGGQGQLWDKQLHFVAYAGLTVAAAYATAVWRRTAPRRAVVVLLAVLGYGLGIELIQGTLPGRDYSAVDLLANAIGVVLGSVWFVVERYVAYRRLPGEIR